MYNHFQLAAKYLRYYITASNGRGHGIHSPFVFDFITTVLNDRQEYPAYEKVENLRKQLLADTSAIQVQDFGAGSSTGASARRSIASITRNAAKPRKYGQLLYRMVRKYKPATILEMGASLGITSSYLALGTNWEKFITMEGSPGIAERARENFDRLQLRHIELREGNFDQELSAVLGQFSSIDFIFVDGNHRKEPTVSYFRQLLAKATANTIIVFDDIHWSREMEQAWTIIRSDERVRCSIDLFFIGILFFREEFMEKQDFTIRF